MSALLDKFPVQRPGLRSEQRYVDRPAKRYPWHRHFDHGSPLMLHKIDARPDGGLNLRVHVLKEKLFWHANPQALEALRQPGGKVRDRLF